MKNTKTKKRNKLPLLLGILLLIGAAAYGTRAYFTDSATEQAGIKLTLGNLKIESVTDSKWVYNPGSEDKNDNTALKADGKEVIKGENIDVKNAKNITNVQPGDKFERVFTFENTGNLAQVVTLDNAEESNNDSIFKVEFKQISDGAEIKPEPIVLKEKEDKVQYKMIISVKTDDKYNEDYNIKTPEDSGTFPTEKQVFDAVEKAVKVTAVQTNK